MPDIINPQTLEGLEKDENGFYKIPRGFPMYDEPLEANREHLGTLLANNLNYVHIPIGEDIPVADRKKNTLYGQEMAAESNTTTRIVRPYTGNPVVLQEMAENSIGTVGVRGKTARTPDRDPTPDSPVALSGIANPVVQVSGRNLAGPWEQGTINETGAATPSESTIRTGYIKVSGTYTISSSDTWSSSLYLYDDNKLFASMPYVNKVGLSVTFTHTGYARLRGWRVGGGNATPADAPTIQMMLNSGTAPLPYELYAGNAYTLPIASPLYGNADVYDERYTDGREVRRWGVKVLDGTENYTAVTTSESGVYRWVTNIWNMMAAPTVRDLIGIHCSHFVETSSVGTYSKQVGVSSAEGGGIIYIYSPMHNTTVDDFKAWLAAQHAAGTPVTIVYPLTEPTITQSTSLLIDNPAGDVVIAGPSQLTVDIVHHVEYQDSNKIPITLQLSAHMVMLADGRRVEDILTSAATNTLHDVIYLDEYKAVDTISNYYYINATGEMTVSVGFDCKNGEFVPTEETAFALLPVGYRPEKNVHFGLIGSNGAGAGDIYAGYGVASTSGYLRFNFRTGGNSITRVVGIVNWPM